MRRTDAVCCVEAACGLETCARQSAQGVDL